MAHIKSFFVVLGAILGVGFIISIPCAWVTHIVWWITLAMNEDMDTMGELALAILGTLIFPIGVIHGYILWF